MRFGAALFLAALLAGSPAVASQAPRRSQPAAVRARDDQAAAAVPDFLPGAYIVEFADENDTPSSFCGALAADLGLEVEARVDLRSKLFNGVSVQIRNGTAAASSLSARGGDASTVADGPLRRQVAASSRVKQLWPIRVLHMDQRQSSDSTPRVTPRNKDRVSSKPVFPSQESISKTTTTTHVMTQVDQLRAKGLTGKGIKVAIVDGGVDWSHPALGGCFGPGCLVESGWDFVGDNFLPGVRPAVPDSDPMDNCEGHGTHVAGIVAAQLAGNEFNFTGAAPGVSIRAYRVWGCARTTTADIMMAAFARAYDEGANIISCSDGDPSGWGDAWATVASRIADAGVSLTVSAGNDGGQSLFYISSPANARGVAGIGAVANTVYPGLLKEASFRVDGAASETEFSFLPGEPPVNETVQDYTLWSAQTTSDNACSALPADTPDLSNSVVLVEHPNSQVTRCYPNDQGANIAAKGGKYLIYYDRDNKTYDETRYVYTNGILGVASVPLYVAEQWLSLLNNKMAVTLTLPAVSAAKTRLEEVENNVSGGFTTEFSSWGPTWELAVSPTFTTPGGNILSTYPQAKGSYIVFSGTSMSAPLAAGIYSLLMEALGPLPSARLRSLLATTARPLAWFDGTAAHPDLLAPVAQQGSGMLQAADALRGATVDISVDSLSFNDSDHTVATQSFRVRNSGAAAVSFRLSNRPTVTMNFLGELNGILTPDFLGRAPLPGASAELTFSPAEITVAPGSEVEVTVTCTPPVGVNATLLPVYGGYVTLTSDHDQVANRSVAYLGVVGSMRSTAVLLPSRVYLANYNIPARDNSSYVLTARPDPANPPRADRGDDGAEPNVYIQPNMGTRSLQVDVMRGEEVLGALWGWPLNFAPRVDKRAYFKGLLADGTVLEPGTYAMRVRALRVFGDETKDDDWDVINTSPFSFTYSS